MDVRMGLGRYDADELQAVDAGVMTEVIQDRLWSVIPWLVSLRSESR